MSTKTQRRLDKIANTLETIVMKTLEAFIYAIQLVVIDAAWGKARYRRRTSQQRPIIHRTYNRTVIYRTMLPSERITHRVRRDA